MNDELLKRLKLQCEKSQLKYEEFKVSEIKDLLDIIDYKNKTIRALKLNN